MQFTLVLINPHKKVTLDEIWRARSIKRSQDTWCSSKSLFVVQPTVCKFSDIEKPMTKSCILHEKFSISGEFKKANQINDWSKFRYCQSVCPVRFKMFFLKCQLNVLPNHDLYLDNWCYRINIFNINVITLTNIIQ